MRPLIGKTLTGVSTCPASGMRACGIPAHFVIAGEMAKLREEIRSIKDSLVRDKTELNQRLDAVPAGVVSAILDNIAVNGAHPITRDDITRLSEGIISRVAEMIRSSTPAATETSDAIAPQSETPKYRSFVWDGRIHPVPQGWKLPRPSVKAFFLLWHFGKADESIAPFRTFSRFDVSKQDWIEVCRARSLFQEMAAIASQREFLQPGTKFCDLQAVRLSEVFDCTFAVLLEQLYGSGDRRDGDKTIGTVYNKLMSKKRKNPEE